MPSKLPSASPATRTLAAIFSIFANRIMLVFVSFLLKRCPLRLKTRRFACSILRAGSFGCMWFSTLAKSEYIARRTLLLLRRAATEGPKLKPCICSGLWRRRSAGVMGLWRTLGGIVCTRQFFHLWWALTSGVEHAANQRRIPNPILGSAEREDGPLPAQLRRHACAFGQCVLSGPKRKSLVARSMPAAI